MLLIDSIHQLLPSIENRNKIQFLSIIKMTNMIIKADEDKFKQILENLILNANRTTEHGKIECIVTRTLSNLTII